MLFQTIKFCISTQFRSIWPMDRTLSGDTTPDQRAIAIKGNPDFSKAPALLEPHHQIFSCHIQEIRSGLSYPSGEMQSVFSAVPADWTVRHLGNIPRYICYESTYCLEFSSLLYKHLLNDRLQWTLSDYNWRVDLKIWVTKFLVIKIINQFLLEILKNNCT